MCPGVSVSHDSVLCTKTLKPAHSAVIHLRGNFSMHVSKRLGIPIKATVHFPACVCAYGVYAWFSLAAVSVLMEGERERGGLQDPVCQQPACERHCLAEVHHWQMSKSPLNPRFAPPFPSWSIFLFCLWAQRTQRPFKTATGKHIWSCCNQGHCSSSMLTNTTIVLLVWNRLVPLSLSRSCIITAWIVGACTSAAFHVVYYKIYLFTHSQGNCSSSDMSVYICSSISIGPNRCQSLVGGACSLVMKLSWRSSASLSAQRDISTGNTLGGG